MKTRRAFLRASAATAATLGIQRFSLPLVAAEETKLPRGAVQMRPEIEPLVKLIEDTPRERLLEEIGQRVRAGLPYRDLLSALLLAGVRNIQPRPVGFKFHAVLVVNSAHLASRSGPEQDRWLPIFWALDNFKESQAADVREGDWTMSALDESALPPPERARKAFEQAMDDWDEAAADVAVASLARSASPQEIFEVFCRYGARDFRDIGHKAIYVANSWRTLQEIGWEHAEPVLRSLAYALLERGSENPAKSDLAPDRPWRRNLPLSTSLRENWTEGNANPEASTEMLMAARDGSDEDASARAIELINRGVAPGVVWDGLFGAAAEQTMRRPNILSLHAVTTLNALRYAFETSRIDATRRMLLLQAAAFMPLFRGSLREGPRFDALEPQPTSDVAEVFANLGADRMQGARKALGWLQEKGDAKALIDTARQFVFLKGSNSHDYKFSSAVLEDYRHVGPAWRDRFLAASVFLLRGADAKDNRLVQRTRAALA